MPTILTAPSVTAPEPAEGDAANTRHTLTLRKGLSDIKDSVEHVDPAFGTLGAFSGWNSYQFCYRGFFKEDDLDSEIHASVDKIPKIEDSNDGGFLTDGGPMEVYRSGLRREFLLSALRRPVDHLESDQMKLLEALSVRKSYVDVPLKYRCGTVTKMHRSLYFHQEHGKLVLWEPYTALKYYIDSTTFGSFEDRAEDTATYFDEATKYFNDTILDNKNPRPRFKREQSKTNANIVVKYAYNPDAAKNPATCTDICTAFFPGQQPVIYIYPAAFKAGIVEYLSGIFVHELMHVHGVRHYFAPNEDIRAGTTSVWMGPDDELTCTNYLRPDLLTLRKSDVDALEMLYNGEHSFPVEHKHAYTWGQWKAHRDSV